MDEPSWRKPAGIGMILALILAWSALIASAAPTVGGWHWSLQAVFYLVVGTVWILPLKPLLNFHPLLTFGNPGALRMMRELGFATFDAVFDESYDDEPDPRRRFDMVYGEFRRLLALDDDAWGRLKRKVADVMTHNARWGLTEVADSWRREGEVALLDAILAGVRRRQA